MDRPSEEWQSVSESPVATGSAIFSRNCEKTIIARQRAWRVRRSWKGQVVHGLVRRVYDSGPYPKRQWEPWMVFRMEC